MSVLAKILTPQSLSLPTQKFTAEAGSSRMFGSAPQDILDKFSTLNVTDNEHHNAGKIPPLLLLFSSPSTQNYRLVLLHSDTK